MDYRCWDGSALLSKDWLDSPHYPVQRQGLRRLWAAGLYDDLIKSIIIIIIIIIIWYVICVIHPETDLTSALLKANTALPISRLEDQNQNDISGCSESILLHVATLQGINPSRLLHQGELKVLKSARALGHCRSLPARGQCLMESCTRHISPSMTKLASPKSRSFRQQAWSYTKLSHTHAWSYMHRSVPALQNITIAVMWNELHVYNCLTAHRIATPVCYVFADLKPTV